MICGVSAMGFAELFLIGLGLSADAFSASICRGMNMRALKLGEAYKTAFFFGSFQAAMPIIGYLLGTGFADIISAFDHWTAFVLLAFIGGKTALGSFKKNDERSCNTEKTGLAALTVLAVATSIDALAVGVTFAFLDVRILPTALLIGVTTFALSLGGVLIGNRFGAKFKSKAELAGGVILILIGLKILLEHLGIIAF